MRARTRRASARVTPCGSHLPARPQFNLDAIVQSYDDPLRVRELAGSAYDDTV